MVLDSFTSYEARNKQHEKDITIAPVEKNQQKSVPSTPTKIIVRENSTFLTQEILENLSKNNISIIDK